MQQNELFQKPIWKILLILITLILIINIFQNGYYFGKWLYEKLN